MKGCRKETDILRAVSKAVGLVGCWSMRLAVETAQMMAETSAAMLVDRKAETRRVTRWLPWWSP